MRGPRRSNLVRFLPALTLAGAATVGPALAQQPASAEELFDRGMADWKAGRIEQGCAAIGESLRLDPRPGTLFTLATCEAEAGHAATAWTRFGEYLSLFDRLPPDVQKHQGERPRIARAQRDTLAPQLSELTLLLSPGAPSGTVVKRNGVVISEASLGSPVPVDAGQYVVTAEAPGVAVREQRITLAAGEKKTVSLTITAPTPAPEPVESPDLGTAAWATGGVGLAGLVLGAITGGMVLSRKSTLNAHCGAAVQSSDPTACDSAGLKAASGLSGLGVASTVGFVVGIAGVGTAVVLFVVEPKAPAGQSSGETWLSVGIASAGAAATTLVVQGAW